MITPNDPMAEIRASFFIECEELHEALQDGLQLIDDDNADCETINVVFRAVHSIKGGAGAFGLDGLVHFAHRFETTLEEVRSGRMDVDDQALKIFFRATDHLGDLVRFSRDGAELPEDRTTELLGLLDGLLGSTGVPDVKAENEIVFVPIPLSSGLDLGGGAPAFDLSTMANSTDIGGATLPPPDQLGGRIMNRYSIKFTPRAALFERGNDAPLLMRNLQMLGETTVYCDASKIPELDQLTPEVPYLSWEIKLQSEVDFEEVRSIFEFVEGLCQLEITNERSDGTQCQPLVNDPPLTEVAAAPAIRIATAEPSSDPPKAAKVTAVSAPLGDKSTPSASKSVVRVDIDRIERLVNLVGELVINQAMLSQSLEHAGLSPHSDAMNGLEEFQRLTRDIQDSVMMIRAQPVKSLFQRMSRIVREASAAVEKDVRLHTIGETTEVDKTVIERLADPLTHMIRNAVDHGLETTQERLSAGKPAQGNISLAASHRSGRVVIDVSDDGGGINRAKVLQIAIAKGLIPPDANPSSGEIDNLLFLPGFSTASEVSDLSGRGVGMDVVRTSIQSLGGRITISSEPGVGTCFSISLPLTLAVLDGMVIEVAQETLVLPLNLVIETLTLGLGDVEMVRPGSMVVRARDGFVPMIDLGAELGYRKPLDNTDGLVVLLVSHEDGNRAALLIDTIVDQRQVVIKGLDDSFYRAPGIAAATILGDGQIALILDPSDIISQVLTQSNLRHQIQ